MNFWANIQAFFASLFSSSAHAVTPVVIDMPGALRTLAKNRNLLVGAAVNAQLLSDTRYTDIITREFNIITTENALKFGVVAPTKREEYHFDDADRIVAFAKAHQIALKGHVLIWHEQLPQWFIANADNEEFVKSAFEQHINTVVSKYQNAINIWDVVNEAFEESGQLRDSLWRRALGDDYIARAFTLSHAANPQAVLFYNDFNIEVGNAKSDAVYQLCKNLRAAHIPIDGIGMQMHLTDNGYPDIAKLKVNISRFEALGLKVAVTEMDVRIKTPASAAKLQKQANIYRNVLGEMLKAKNLHHIIFWGVDDGHSWVPGFFTGYGDALLFDAQYLPKPAYTAVQQVLE